MIAMFMAAALARVEVPGDQIAIDLHSLNTTKAFEFRGVVAGKPVNTDKLRCANPQGGVQQCTIRNRTVAGVDTSVQSFKL